MTTSTIGRALRDRVTFLFALGTVTAGFAWHHALAQTLPAGIPAAPAGGISAAKLPDANGVHLGMSPDEALAVMKGLYPGNALQIYHAKSVTGQTWVSKLAGGVGPCNNACDETEVYFSMSPSPVQVISIWRQLILAPGKEPTLETTVASLRQKYGKEVVSDGVIMAWVYDEEGQPIKPQGPSNWSPASCAGRALGFKPGEAGPPTAAMVVTEALGPTPLAQQLPGLIRDLCNQNVYVQVQLDSASIQGTPVVHSINMHLSENSLGLRDAVANQQYFDAQAAAKQQQQQKDTQQQKAPTL
jgi:hypothetical protein